MPFDSNGVYSLPPGYLAVSGQTILATQHNPPLEDIGSALSQALLRSGVAPLSGNLSAAGFKLTNLANGADDGDSVNMSQLNSVSSSVTNSAPPGAIQGFRRKNVPAGWLLEDGRTIGSAASGATSRANADTLPLYTVLWTDFNNTELPIQDSSGAATSRGASASADFNANKRLPLFDSRTRFLRGSDSGLSYDATLIPGASQSDDIKSHTHTAAATGDTTHPHSVRGVNPGGSGSTGVVSGSFTGFTDAVVPNNVPLPTITVNPTGGALETRPRSSVVLYCIKL